MQAFELKFEHGILITPAIESLGKWRLLLGNKEVIPSAISKDPALCYDRTFLLWFYLESAF